MTVSPQESPGLVHRYWRLATVLAAVILAVAYLPDGGHSPARTSQPAPNSFGAQTSTPAGTGESGATVSGAACLPGTRQAPFSAYADFCIPTWHGNNGGATSHGVTGNTITLSYREASTSELQLLYSLVPPAVVGTNQEAISTMQAYIKVFNHYFDLYGRHVVLKPFTGKSNFVIEDAGLDAPQAQADAATASDLGAFADVSLVDSSEMYVSDLGSDKVVALSLYVEPSSWYRSRAPFQYTTGPDCDKEATAAAAILAKTVEGVRAHDVGRNLAGKLGKIGIVYPLTGGEFPACARAIADDLRKHFHISPAKVTGYTFNLATLQSQAQTIMADMSSAGVTAVVCSSCDPITPQSLVEAAVAEGYFPQWYVEPAFALAGSDDENFVRLLPKAAIAHVIQPGTVSVPRNRQEAYAAWKLSGGTGSLSPTYPFVYAQLLMFYDALQNAGPDLTPQSFEKGVFAIPPSAPGGQFGAWKAEKGVFDPQSGFTIMHWDPSRVSAQDGQRGSFVSCDANTSFTYGSYLPALLSGKPLVCP